MNGAELIIAYAMSQVGKPYIWGDKNPAVGGWDCSGLCSEIAKFMGILKYNEFLNAQGLYDRWAPNATHGVFQPLCFAFYGKSLINGITHVAFMVSPYQIIHAAGGDSTTTTVQAADLKERAFVRGDLVDYRKDLLITLKPAGLERIGLR